MDIDSFETADFAQSCIDAGVMPPNYLQYIHNHEGMGSSVLNSRRSMGVRALNITYIEQPVNISRPHKEHLWECKNHGKHSSLELSIE